MNKKQSVSQRLKLVAISILLAFLLMICPGFLRGISFKLDFVVSHAAYFAVVNWLVRKHPQYRIAIITAWVCTIGGIYLLLGMVAGRLPLESLPNFASTIWGCINAYLFYGFTTRRSRAVLVLCTASVCAWYVAFGGDLWHSKNYFGTFSGRTFQASPAGWHAYLDTFSDSNISQTNRDVIVLDFFNTHCAPCFAKFPKLQKLHEKYRSNTQVFISSVNIPYTDDNPYNTVQMLKERGYTFPVLIGKDGLDSLFGIQLYPTVIIMTKNAIIYRGDITAAEDIIVETLTKTGK